MSTSSFNLRNIDPELMSLLRKQSTDKKISINSLILEIISQALGASSPTKKKSIFHDLDDLAGTWTHKDKKDFDERIQPFKKIDKDLWS